MVKLNRHAYSIAVSFVYIVYILIFDKENKENDVQYQYLSAVLPIYYDIRMSTRVPMYTVYIIIVVQSQERLYYSYNYRFSKK